MKSKLSNIVKILNHRKLQILILVSTVFAPYDYAYADAADTKWEQTIDFFGKWIERAGGGLILIGAIEFAMGWRSDDPDKKTGGIRFMISGCITFAVGISAKTFLV